MLSSAGKAPAILLVAKTDALTRGACEAIRSYVGDGGRVLLTLDGSGVPDAVNEELLAHWGARSDGPLGGDFTHVAFDALDAENLPAFTRGRARVDVDVPGNVDGVIEVHVVPVDGDPEGVADGDGRRHHPARPLLDVDPHVRTGVDPGQHEVRRLVHEFPEGEEV